MGRYTKQDVIDLVRENDVEFIRLQFSDLFGTMKNVAITARQLEKALDNKCTFDGSSVDGFVRIEESDMYLYPDLNTFEIFPWRPQQGKVARMTDFGAFVELAPGVDALLHVSQISQEHVEKPSDVLKIGQEVEAKIVDFNEEEKKISLSIKALAAPAEDAETEE